MEIFKAIALLSWSILKVIMVWTKAFNKKMDY